MSHIEQALKDAEERGYQRGYAAFRKQKSRLTRNRELLEAQARLDELMRRDTEADAAQFRIASILADIKLVAERRMWQ